MACGAESHRSNRFSKNITGAAVLTTINDYAIHQTQYILNRTLITLQNRHTKYHQGCKTSCLCPHKEGMRVEVELHSFLIFRTTCPDRFTMQESLIPINHYECFTNAAQVLKKFIDLKLRYN